MITQENWIEFIQKFFGASGTTDWMNHVASGWNHLKGEPGCNCAFTWYAGPVECEGYQGIQATKLVDSTTTETAIFDLEGIGNYLDRKDDTNNLFEDDFGAAKASGETGLTAAPDNSMDSTETFLLKLRPPVVPENDA